ncbi:MAG TPA: dTDP-4-dehydrorhamnose 3,5-epimerase [Bacteroidaceae bacterium]|nr:dTDP-4-dehydrorhamnose 3,5-epimerase [Bacteroidaceae bacterium]
MNIIKTAIEGVVILEPKVFEDARGYFFESFSDRQFKAQVLDTTFVQDNESKSSYGVVRGLHFQTGEAAQSKLVRCVVGKVLDVAVDIRPHSATFGQYVSCELSAENKRQMFIPKGLAHGFAVLSEEAIFAYKCDNFYSPANECAILWNDPNINIDWKIPADKVQLSEKDAQNLSLKEYMTSIK